MISTLLPVTKLKATSFLLDQKITPNKKSNNTTLEVESVTTISNWMLSSVDLILSCP